MVTSTLGAFAIGGSRSLSLAGQALATAATAALLGAGYRLVVGCCVGADAAVMAALEDYSFLNLRGRIEYEANLFAAELLLDDGEVFSLMQEYTRDQAAAILRIDPGLLDFKLFSMQKRDFQIRLPITFDSEFLAK